MAFPVTWTAGQTLRAADLNANFGWADNGGRLREFTVTLAADSTMTSANNLTFSPAFANTVGIITIGYENYTGTDDAILGHNITNKTVSGFTLQIMGGQNGSQITVNIRVSGT